MRLRGTIIPEQRERRPEDCHVVMFQKLHDTIIGVEWDEAGAPKPIIKPGSELEIRQVPCRWWQWLGRRWRLRAWADG